MLLYSSLTFQFVDQCCVYDPISRRHVKKTLSGFIPSCHFVRSGLFFWICANRFCVGLTLGVGKMFGGNNISEKISFYFMLFS